MKQLTFTLEEWTGQSYTYKDGELVPAPSFKQQIFDLVEKHKGYRVSQFKRLPNRAQNVNEGLLILVKDDPSEDIVEKRNQIIAMLYQCMNDKNDARETLKLVDELIELK